MSGKQNVLSLATCKEQVPFCHSRGNFSSSFPSLLFFSSDEDKVQSLTHLRPMFYLAFEFGVLFWHLFLSL